jgi:hypothetical protein
MFKFSLQQFINVPGLKALGLVFSQPNFLIPNYHVRTLADLDLLSLKQSAKIECVVFDKDNTLRYF